MLPKTLKRRRGKKRKWPRWLADKGYHSTETVKDFAALQIRSYISEPKRGRRKWKGNIEGRDATYANRRRIRGERGRELLRRRGEKLERSFAHLYRTGGMRRTEVRGHDNVAKRLLIQAGAFNLGMVMRSETRRRDSPGPPCPDSLRFVSLFRAEEGPEETDQHFPLKV